MSSSSLASAASHPHHHAAARSTPAPAAAHPEADRLADYKEIRTIGRGKFGVCKLVEAIATGKQYVLKCIPLSDQSERERLLALQEVETLKQLQIPKAHPFIVKYHDSFLYQDSIYICMQHCSGGDLHHFLRARKATGVHLEETVIIDWLIQLLLAIRRCHDRKVS
jgi:serine/threonine protein kinase